MKMKMNDEQVRIGARKSTPDEDLNTETFPPSISLEHL